jgi:hypothetical protein
VHESVDFVDVDFCSPAEVDESFGLPLDQGVFVVWVHGAEVDC